MAAMMESDDDEDGGADFGAIGFMFDAETSRSERRFSFPIGGGAAPAPAPAPAPAVGEEASLLEVRLMCIDDDPGFVQSGHYIWPAASTMATFLAAHWDRDYPADASRPLPTVVELGAGCGLAGLAAMHLGASEVVFTDHDPKTLDLIRENVAMQQEALASSAGRRRRRSDAAAASASASSSSSSSSPAAASACLLAWGAEHRKDWPPELLFQDVEGGGEDGPGEAASSSK